MTSRITRRVFLTRSSKGVVAATVIPAFLGPVADRVFAGLTSKDMPLKDYYSHFGVDEQTIREVMNEALSRGGDYCDLFFEHTIANDISLEDKAVNRASSSVDYGVGIRVLKGDQTGYSFTEEVTPAAMKLAARTAAEIAASGQTPGPVQMVLHPTPDYYPIETSWEDVSVDEKIPYLQTLNDKVFALDSRVIKSRIAFSNSTSYILIATSEGRVATDYRPLSRITANCTAEQNHRREENRFDLSGRQGIEAMTPQSLDFLAREAVRRTVVLFDAVKPEAGEMEVVLAPGGAGILLHEAIGHGMEADFNRKSTSIFCDKMGKPVAQPFVTIVDDGTLSHARGSLNLDDEANDTERTFLVQDGILTSYMHDRISAQFYGVKPTGNGRRESFRFPPMPRMRNTFMLSGPHAPADIIKSVKHGLYAEGFTNGEVHIGPGDFSFYVKSGQMIENGELAKPVKDVNLIGNGPQVLSDIVMVGNDYKLAEGGWTCGKNGQSVPVSQGLPTVKVSKITVGGVTG
ncbi:MAG TPA: TldD/PmbA family protein [bacterium]|nr:TldD/PmbA family protein [bacterium]